MLKDIYFKVAIAVMVIGMIRFLAIMVARVNTMDAATLFWLALVAVQIGLTAVLAFHLRPEKD